jgi:8-oxo-dGTP pyrophosphatase MutT (NUDIX family)
MTPAPSAGSEGTKKKRRRRRPGNRAPQALTVTTPTDGNSPAPKPAAMSPGNTPSKKSPERRPYAKRVDEVSAGGLVIDFSGTRGLLIGRIDHKDASRERLLWSLPKGHIEAGETPEQAAIREVLEETGITSEITKSIGVIDFWFMAGGKRIHKTVHHFIFKEVSGELTPQITEVDEVSWFPLSEIVGRLAYPDEKKLIAKSGEISI